MLCCANVMCAKSAMQIPWRKVDALLHDGGYVEPEGVEYGEVVVQAVGILARVVVPLVWREATDEEQDERDADERQRHTIPHLDVERLHEAEHARLLLLGLLDHDADAHVHEGHGELDGALALRRDGERRDRYVGLVAHKLAHHAVPVAAGVARAELVVLDERQLVGEVEHLGQALGEVDTVADEAVVARVIERVVAHHEERLVRDAHDHQAPLDLDLTRLVAMLVGTRMVEHEAGAGRVVAHLHERLVQLHLVHADLVVDTLAVAVEAHGAGEALVRLAVLGAQLLDDEAAHRPPVRVAHLVRAVDALALVDVDLAAPQRHVLHAEQAAHVEADQGVDALDKVRQTVDDQRRVVL